MATEPLDARGSATCSQINRKCKKIYFHESRMFIKFCERFTTANISFANITFAIILKHKNIIKPFC